jgi:hypothetical protein
MNGAFAEEYFRTAISDVVTDVGSCIVEIAWYLTLQLATPQDCCVLTMQDELFRHVLFRSPTGLPDIFGSEEPSPESSNLVSRELTG